MRTLLILTAVSVLSSLPALADNANMMSKPATVNSMSSNMTSKMSDQKPAKAKNAKMGSPNAMSGMAHSAKPAKAKQP
jgi:hypothetical protein